MEKSDLQVDIISQMNILITHTRTDSGKIQAVSYTHLDVYKRQGLTTIPAIVRKLSDDDAIVAMVDANIQREELLPGEKAFAYKMKQEAMKHQGSRTDLTLGQNVPKFKRTTEAIADGTGESYKQIATLRNQLNDGPINQIQMLSIFNNCVMAKKVSRSLTFSEKKLTKYFPDDYTAKDMEQVIESLLEKWTQEQSC